jgi:uncharacterized membrane protein
MSSTALIVHVSAGLIGLASGGAALLLRKGGRPHRTAGKVFVVSMLTMCGAALYIAVVRRETPNILAAVLTAYMVMTAWLAVKRRPGKAGALSVGAMIFAVAGSISALAISWDAAKDPSMTEPLAPVAFAFGVLMGVAAIGDLTVVIGRSRTGAQTIARHLWRMCAALFIGAASFFIGQGANVFPQSVRDTKVLFVPVVAVLVTMIYWLIRVRVTSTPSTRQ